MGASTRAESNTLPPHKGPRAEKRSSDISKCSTGREKAPEPPDSAQVTITTRGGCNDLAQGLVSERTLDLALGVDDDARVVLEVDDEAVLPAEGLALAHHNERVRCTQALDVNATIHSQKWHSETAEDDAQEKVRCTGPMRLSASSRGVSGDSSRAYVGPGCKPVYAASTCLSWLVRGDSGAWRVWCTVGQSGGKATRAGAHASCAGQACPSSPCRGTCHPGRRPARG